MRHLYVITIPSGLFDKYIGQAKLLETSSDECNKNMYLY